jgi:hypothetical protein
VWTLKKRQVFLVANSCALFYLSVIVDMTWDCRVYHQLVEIIAALLCTLLVTLTRKLIGRLKSRDVQNNDFVAPTVVQKGILGAATSACAVEIFVSGAHASRAMQITKTTCWAAIVGNALYHFIWRQVDLRAAFADFVTPPGVKPSSSPASSDPRKILRVKKKLKTSMHMTTACVFLCGGTYAWWPRGKDDFTCATRSYDGVLMARTIISTGMALMAHLNFWYSIWVFREKKTRENNQPPRANYGHGEHQRWYSLYRIRTITNYHVTLWVVDCVREGNLEIASYVRDDPPPPPPSSSQVSTGICMLQTRPAGT